MVEQEPNSFSLVQQARYTHMKSDHEQAVALMTEARTIAGDRWDESDEEQLAFYREAAGITSP